MQTRYKDISVIVILFGYTQQNIYFKCTNILHLMLLQDSVNSILSLSSPIKIKLFLVDISDIINPQNISCLCFRTQIMSIIFLCNFTQRISPLYLKRNHCQRLLRRIYDTKSLVFRLVTVIRVSFNNKKI